MANAPDLLDRLTWMAVNTMDNEVDALCTQAREAIQARDAEIKRLRAEVERLTDEMSTMHRTVVHDCCVQVQSERALADQLADALRWQADPYQTGTLGMSHRALDAYEEARRG